MKDGDVVYIRDYPLPLKVRSSELYEGRIWVGRDEDEDGPYIRTFSIDPSEIV
jgi:hypothetical protein